MKQYLRKYDKQLKSFEVSKALDTALQVNTHPCGYNAVWYTLWLFRWRYMFVHVSQTWTRTSKPEVTVAVIIELNRRGTLKNALAGRNEESLTKILNFLLKWVTLSHIFSNTHIVPWLQTPIQNTMAHKQLEGEIYEHFGIKLKKKNLIYRCTTASSEIILEDLNFISVGKIMKFSKITKFSNLLGFLKQFLGEWVIFH